MRFAISGFSRKGGRARAAKVCDFVRDCKSGMCSIFITSFTELTCRQDFDRFAPLIKGLRKKQTVTNQSLEKIENGIYLYCLSSRGSVEAIVQLCMQLSSELLNMIYHQKCLMISLLDQCPIMRTRTSGVATLAAMMTMKIIIKGAHLVFQVCPFSFCSPHACSTFDTVHSLLRSPLSHLA